MSAEKIDYYATILADAEAKIAALQELVASVKKAAALGALSGQSIEVSATTSLAPESVDLPVGAFSGLSVPAAIKMYLGAIKRKQTAPQIVAALKDGGMESTASNFYTVVAGALLRLKRSSEVLRFKDGWGLASLYPEHIRKAAATQESKPARKKAKKPIKGKTKTKAKAEQSDNPSVVVPITQGVEQRIANLLNSAHGKSFHPSDIAKALELNSTGVSLTLGRMAAKGIATKCNSGEYMAKGDAKKAI